MNAVTVLTFNEPEQAQPVKSRLEQAGILAEIHDERKLQRFGFMAPALAGIQVRVEPDSYQRACQLLAEWGKTDQTLSKAIHCPSCTSSRVEFPQFTRKFFLPSIGLLLARLGMIEPKFYCQDCQFTWPIKDKLETPKDVLGWPKK